MTGLHLPLTTLHTLAATLAQYRPPLPTPASADLTAAGVPETLESILRAVSLGYLVDYFGVFPAVAIVAGFLLVSYWLLADLLPTDSADTARTAAKREATSRLDDEPFAGDDTTSDSTGLGDSGLEKASAAINKLQSGDDVDLDAMDESENPRLTEALQRLKTSDKPETGEAFRDILQEIDEEAESDEVVHTPFVQDGEERSIADTLAVAPEKLEEQESYLKRNGKYVREMIVAEYPGRVSFGWLDRLFTSSVNVRVSYQIKPRDSDSMQRRLNVQAARVMSQLREKQRENRVDTTEEQSTLEQINRLRDQLTEGTTSVFDFGLYLEVIADDEDELENATAEVKQMLKQANARVIPLYDRQKDSMTSVAPLAKDHSKHAQIMDTQSLATTFPFIEPSVVAPDGVLFGFHKITNTPVVVDRFGDQTSGNNCLISGKIGSGKSYLAKLETWRRLMMDPEVEVLIIDPVNGFADLVDALDGQRITVDGNSVINPMEIRESATDEDAVDSYEQKVASVLGLFKSSFRGELSKQEEGILIRSIRFAYLKQGITQDPSTHDNKSPVVQDVLDILKHMSQGKNPRDFLEIPEEVERYISSIEMDTNANPQEGNTGADQKFIERNIEQESEYAYNVWVGLEDFQEGGANSYLNGETTVDIHDRIVQFDVSAAVDKGSAPLLMHVVLDWLFQRTKGTPKRNQVVIDEAHYMLDQPHALDMLELFARHSRHYRSALTLISQTVAEFMEGQAKHIYDQCDIRALMRHEHLGAAETDALNISERERQFVLQAQEGNTADYSEGLLYVSSVGHLRMRVISNDFEHAVIDDAFNAWAFLYEAGFIDWPAIPEHNQAEAWDYLSDESRREIQATYGNSNAEAA